ncbi:MAG: hypothetical protein EOP48_16440 [Sphingobacteriales bacterium]|nr:MAG: hypothetical protein EOP48_16440 [Sphingobacteriales bacterium]
MNLAKIIILTACILSLSNCKKTEKLYRIDKDLTQFFDWQKGSYWIMKDSVSGQIDSFVLLDRAYGSQYLPSQDMNQETIELFINQYQVDSPAARPKVLTIFLRAIKFIAFNYDDLTKPHRYEFIDFKGLDSLNLHLAYFTIGTQTFSDVRFDFLKPSSTTLGKSKFYINHGSGLIKLELNISQRYVWEVIRSKMVQ